MKTRSLKSRKIEIFPKGLVHGFGQKGAIFLLLFLANIGQENVFYDILERKNVFPDYENKKFKKSKNSDFSKGVSPSMVLFKKGPFFRLLFLDNIGQENVFYDILERENVFPDYEKKKFKKSKNSDFSKGVSPWFWSKRGHFSVFCF